jgi:hypothetical protein
VCIALSDTREALRCIALSDTSRSPLPAAALAAVGQDQGSSTARAPVQAGGVGSSPAPDANRSQSLPDMVLTIVNKQLDELELRKRKVES